MSKQDYIQANKDWLAAKAKEEDVKALPKGIYYKVISEGKMTGSTLLHEVSSPPTIPDGPSMARSLTVVGAEHLSLSG